MLSRVAESIYWMSRYLERAENLARIIDAHSNLTLDIPDLYQSNDNWSALAQASGDYKLFQERYASEDRDQVIEFLAFDREYPNSMASCVREARENARSIREIIAPELWEQINRLYHRLQRNQPDPSQPAEHLYDFFYEIKMLGLSFGGIVSDTMSHTEGWNWFRCGRLMERADKTSRIIDVKYFTLLPTSTDVGSPYDQIQWAGLLKSTSSLEAYRSVYGKILPENVIEFLILDRDFPRSILHCLNRAEEALRSVLKTYPNHFQNSAEQLFGQLCAELSYTTIRQITQFGLHEYVDQMQTKLNAVGKEIHTVYFSS